MAEFSGSIRITAGDENKYSLILRCWEDSYSIENNTSRVYWWVGIRSNTQYHNHQGLSEHYKVVVNGTTVHDANHTVSVGSGQTVGIADGYTTVTHNADGSKSISASASFSCGSTAYYAPRSGSCSGSLTLTTIPRATSPSIDKPSLECGSTITISGTSASSSFSHKVYVAWNGTTTYLGTIASGTTTPSFSYTIPTDWEKNLPSSTSGIATFTLETFSASTSVGSKSVNATIKVRSGVVPSIGTVSISDTNSICAGIGQYVQSQSKLKFSIVTSGNQGSTITSVLTKFNGQTYSGSTFTTQAIQNSGTLSYTITVTDSRGRTATKSGSVSVTTYSPPSLTNVSAKRANSGYAVDESSGTYALLHFKVGFTSLSNKNVTSFYIRYRASGTSSWTKINSWDNNYTLEQDYKAGNLFTSTTSTYEIAFGVKDKFMSDYSWQIVTVTSTYTLINFGANGHSMAVGMQSPNDSYFDLNLPGRFRQAINLMGNLILGTVAKQVIGKFIYPVGSVIINTTGTNPGTQFGGTWEQFAPGRVLIGVGTGNDGSTSMTFTAGATGGTYTETLTIDQIPSHNHRVKLMPAANEASGYGLTQTTTFKNRPIVTGDDTNDKRMTLSTSTGGGKSHNNLPPHKVVFYWHRIS